MHNVAQFPEQQRQASLNSNGNGGGGGGDVRERLARLEEKVDGMKENMATKTDIANLKNWILGGLLSAIVIGSAAAATIVKAFF